MCGFIGEFTFENIKNENLKFANKRIVCRGPDNTQSHSYKSNHYSYNLIFNRLSIVDLSENANQPMTREESNSTILFNGEIYNHKLLKKELVAKGAVFKSNHSDTEVVLNGIDIYGKNFINKLRGQFAIVFIDNKNKKIVMARDRVGQKPLYYYLTNKHLVFSSNLISILETLETYKISETSVDEYLNYGVVSSPNTIFENIKKVCPSEIIEIYFDNNYFEKFNSKYWSTDEFVDNKKFHEEEFFDLFSDAVNIRSNADVPIANFLSGGLDSSSIVKNYSLNKKEINTFSVNLDSEKYDESKWSTLVAEKYKTNHNFVNISTKISLNDIYSSINSFDEPYSDPSIVPSFILSKEIAKHYKVAISGDGGDELLGGYVRTHNTLKTSGNFNHFISKFYGMYPKSLGTGNYFLSKSKSKKISYKSFFEDQNLVKLFNNNIHENNVFDCLDESNISLYKKLLLIEYKLYLSEMMMLKVDRTSMANSLEVRSPFVDNKLIEYVLSRETKYIEINNKKNILKKYLSTDFDSSFLNRKKQGFVFDLENWVYSNKSEIAETFKLGEVVVNTNKDILKLLSIKKSRINANRLWKLFVLEKYLQNLP